MNKKWDDLRTAHEMQKWHETWLKECFRALRPGGVIKAFSATRTHHRLAAAMLNVGFILNPEDSLEAWCYGSGFPKSLNVSKALDKMAGAEQEVVGMKVRPDGTCRPNQENWTPGTTMKYAQDAWTKANMAHGGNDITAPTTEEAQLFAGYGTALKPAWEIFLVGRKEG